MLWHENGGQSTEMVRFLSVITALTRSVILGACSIFVTSCGIVTPTIQEPWANSNSYQISVNSIIGQISCEVGQAIRSVYYSNDNRFGTLEFLKGWGAQFSLIMTANEKSALTPGISFIDPLLNGQSFFTNIGGVLSAETNRIDTQQRFYLISEFLKGGQRYDDGRTDRSCISRAGLPGTLFVQTDSGFRDDLYAFISTLYTKTANVPDNAQAGSVVGMTHNIKFEIITTGTVNPIWRLTRIETTSAPLFGVTRDRSQQIIITLGPTQAVPGTKQPALSPAAQNSQNAQELAAFISRALR